MSHMASFHGRMHGQEAGWSRQQQKEVDASLTGKAFLSLGHQEPAPMLDVQNSSRLYGHIQHDST